MHKFLQHTLRWLAATFLVTGCASPNQPTTWLDPAYAGQGFRKIFVVGLSARDLTDQRGFENLMVSALQDAGVLAVPGWQLMPTFNPATVRQDMPAYINQVVDMLRSTRLLRP